jgi:hypothetical protein
VSFDPPIFDLSELRKAPPVCQQPVVNIVAWRILEDADGCLFLGGLRAQTLTMRTTTEICKFEPSARTLWTSSGRKYQLVGPPTEDACICRAIAIQAVRGGVLVQSDQTCIIWTAIQRATH